ncbi:MAG: fatty acid desaturase family protein [Pseudomonadota bacterium]
MQERKNTVLPSRDERLGVSPPDPTPAERAQLRRAAEGLTGPRPHAFLRALLGDWLTMAAVILAMQLIWGGVLYWVLLPIAWIVLAARQHGILVLLHDATHGLAHDDRRLNEWLGELACGAPLFVKMQTYRPDHLAHHQALNGPEDPDWVRKLSDDDEARFWLFPRREGASRFLAWSWIGSVRYLLRSFTHLSGDGASDDRAVDAGDDRRNAPRRGAIATQKLKRARLALYLGVAALLTVFGGWLQFLLLWAAPVLLVLPMIMRLRSIAEHFALPNTHAFNASRTILCGSVERFLFAPHQVAYHLDHHLQPYVAFSELPRLHERLMAMPRYRDEAKLNDGYFFGNRTLLGDMLRKAEPATGSECNERPLPSLT